MKHLMSGNMQLSSKTIRKEILHSARKWGLQPSVKTRDKDFCKKAIDDAIDYLTPSSTLEEDLQEVYSALSCSKLPQKQDDAIRVVLQKVLDDADTDDESFINSSDAIKMKGSPFVLSKNVGNGKKAYILRPDFKKFAQKDLHPFTRFRGESKTPEEWYYDLWHDDKGSLDGTVFEAIVAHYLENHMTCASYLCRNRLRWNCGLDGASSWATVVCIKCYATYAIKAVADLEEVAKCLKINKAYCGSFRSFYNYHTSQRRYLVFVSRGATLEKRQNQLTHRVTLGEIERVLPRLTRKSFISDQRIWLNGVAECQMNTMKNVWCSIPAYKGDFLSLAGEVYSTKYGEGKWNRYEKTNSSNEPESPSNPGIVQESLELSWFRGYDSEDDWQLLDCNDVL